MDLTCAYPLYRIDKNNGVFRLIPQIFQHSERNGGIFISKAEVDYLSSNYNLSKSSFQVIRCGQCFNCRLNRAREWAVRCSQEASYYKYNYFVTLTYNEAFLPRGTFLDYDYSIKESTLSRPDIQNFFKRYRQNEVEKYGSSGIRTLYCGEYGPETSRPHYHAIIMNSHELTDLKFFKRKGSIIHWESEFLTNTWSFYDRKTKLRLPMGQATVSEFSFDTACYVAKYCIEKITGVDKKSVLDYYSTLSGPDVPDLRTQEFIGMSRKPGIGYRYYQDNKNDIYEGDSVVYANKFKSCVSKPPRYFDKLYDIEEPEKMSDVKERRISLSLLDKNQHSESKEDWTRKSLERNERKYKLNTRTL